jgi:Rv2525c-like, glycoside hydrolase-like domain
MNTPQEPQPVEEPNEQALEKLASLGLASPSDGEAPVVTYHYGFDRFAYPGDAVMQDWWSSTPMFWTGFYLAPAPNHPDTSWMTKRATIHQMGWGFAPLYVGRQVGDTLTDAQGRSDAHNASALAATAGFPNQSFLFLDIETGGTLSAAFITYIVAWCGELATATNFRPGVYCSYTSATQIHNALGVYARLWCWRIECPPSPGCHQNLPAPAPSAAYSLAEIWQYAQSGKPGSCSGFSRTGKCNLTSGGLAYSVDLDTAIALDPSL